MTLLAVLAITGLVFMLPFYNCLLYTSHVPIMFLQIVSAFLATLIRTLCPARVASCINAVSYTHLDVYKRQTPLPPLPPPRMAAKVIFAICAVAKAKPKPLALSPPPTKLLARCV